MKIGRTLPPAAALLDMRCVLSGLAGILQPEKHLNRLEQELKRFFQVQHVFLLSSGKAALTLILEALHSLAPAKNRVLIPAYTCFSVPSAIVKAGLDVALCDIDPVRFDYDQSKLTRSIDPDTLCVIADHLFGIPADVEAIAALRHDNDLFIVEDAAQAMGGTSNGRKLGTLGDVGFFSLGRGKNITAGSGGIIITNDDRIAAALGKLYATLPAPGMGENAVDLVKALALAWFIHPSLYWFPAGLPGLRLGETIFEKDFPVKKMSGLKAGLMKNWQGRLESSNKKRKENSLTFCITGDNEKKCSSPAAFLRFPVLAASRDRRDRIFASLRQKGLGASRMYPTAINEVRELQDRFLGVSFPSAEAVAARIVTLPTHELVSARDRQKILSVLGEAMASGTPAAAGADAAPERIVPGGLAHR